MAKKAKLNLGVIGLGRLGYIHALNARRCVDANLVAICDISDQARERAANDFGEGVKSYKDYAAILEDKSIDAVILSTPTKFHYKTLVECIEAGKQIFVEKPITYTVDEAKSIVELADKHKSYVQVGFMRRFDEGHVAAKNMIEAGELGDLIFIQDCQRDPSGPPIHYVPESGGIFVDMAIHDLDCVRWLMGSPIKTIYAEGAVLKHKYLEGMDDVDEGHCMVSFENKALGHVEVSRNANDIYDVRTEIIGSKASVFIGQHQHSPYIKVGGSGFTFNIAHWCLDRFEKAYETEMQVFIKNVLEQKPSPVDAKEGMISLLVSQMATKSCKEGKRITIPY